MSMYEKAMLAHEPLKVKDLMNDLEKAKTGRIKYHIEKIQPPSPSWYTYQQLQQAQIQPSPLGGYFQNPLTGSASGWTTTYTTGNGSFNNALGSIIR